MDVAQTVADLISKNGPLVAFVVLFAVVIGLLAKVIRDLYEKRVSELKEAHAAEVAWLKEALQLERDQKVAAEQRMDSNTAAIREATSGFNTAVGLMERFADTAGERDGRTPTRRRPG